VVLAFIGVKLILHWAHALWEAVLERRRCCRWVLSR
jgi:hypothetical protein